MPKGVITDTLEQLRDRHKSGDPFALYDAVFFTSVYLRNRRPDDGVLWILEAFRDKLRSELVESERGRRYVAYVDRVFNKREKLHARYAVVHWLRHKGVLWTDVFSEAAKALRIGEGTVKNSYNEFKKVERLPRKYVNPHYEKTDPSSFLFGPEKNVLHRTLSQYLRRKKII